MTKSRILGIVFMAVVVNGFLLVMVGLPILGRIADEVLGPRDDPGRPDPGRPDPGQLRGEAADAFGKLPPDLNGDADAEAVRLALNAFARAVRATNRQRVEDALDAPRMFEEFRRAGLPVPARQDAKESTRMSQGLVKALLNNPGLQQLRDAEIRSFKRLGDPDEVVVISRHRDEGFSLKFRWWLRREGGTWRFYDFEDLDTGMHLSATIASLVPADLARPEWAKAGPFMQEATAALFRGDFDGVDRALAAVEPQQLPAALAAQYRFLSGSVEMGRGKFADALFQFDQARALNPDMPCLDYLSGVCHNQLLNADKALECLTRYRALLGDDCNVCYEIGLALERLGRRDEAAAEFRKSLDDEPNAARSLTELARLLAPGKKAELGERFAKFTQPLRGFFGLADDALRRRDTEAVLQYVGVLRRRNVEDIDIDAFEAEARAILGETERALPLLERVLAARRDFPEWKEYGERVLRELARHGGGRAVYTALPSRETFRAVANELLLDRDRDELARLLEAHRARHGDDPWLDFCKAEMHQWVKEYGPADAAYAAAQKGKLDAGEAERVRAARVLARHLAGKSLSAYGEVEPRRNTFAQLAQLFTGNHDTKQLEELVAAHRRQDPDDPALAGWEAELKWWAGDHAAAVKLLQDNRQRIKTDPRYSYPLRRYLLLGLARLGRLDDLRAEAAAIARDKNERFGLVTLGFDCLLDKNVAAVRAVAEVLEKEAPGDPLTAQARWRVHLAEQKLDEAGRALAALPDNDVRSFLHDALSLGIAVEAYGVCPKKEFAFECLASILLEDFYDFPMGRDDVQFDGPLWEINLPRSPRSFTAKAVREEFRRLFEAHGKERPDDVPMLFYRAELHRLAGEYAKAEELFAAGMARPLDKQWEQRFRNARVEARLKSGEAVTAYTKLDPTRATFDRVASHLSFEKDGKRLAALVEAHRARDAADPRLTWWDMEMRWLAGDYEGTVGLARAQLATVPQNQSGPLREKLVRCLVRLKRFDEAAREVEAEGRIRYGSRVLASVVPAARGDVAGTAAALERAAQRGLWAGAIYHDPDLGPLFATEPFRELRERYPELISAPRPAR